MSAYRACGRHAEGRKQDCCPGTKLCSPQQPVYHTAGREAPGTSVLDPWKQIWISVYLGHLTQEPRKRWGVITASKHEQLSSHRKSRFNLSHTGSKAKSPEEEKTMSEPQFFFSKIILSASFSVHMSTMDSQKRASLMGKRCWREPQSRDALTASRGKNHHVRRQRRARPPCFQVTEFTALHTRCLLPSPPTNPHIRTL